MKRSAITAVPATNTAYVYLSVFGISAENRMLWKTLFLEAGGQYWSPPGKGWENLGGLFDSSPAAFLAPGNRVHFLGLGTDNIMFWKYLDGDTWYPSPESWAPLGGVFTSPPTVAYRHPGAEEFHLFGLGTESQMLHKNWYRSSIFGTGSWFPSETGWRSLGGTFASSPAAIASIDIHVVGLGGDNQMYHKVGYDNGRGSVTWGLDWEPLGGIFASPPAIVGMFINPFNKMDIFGLGMDNAMYHKAYTYDHRDRTITWYPSGTLWEYLGGVFASPPTVVKMYENWWSGPYRIHIVGLGMNNGMFHKYWDGAWHPAGTDWEFLGGEFTFTSAPAAVAQGWRERLDIFCLGSHNEMLHKYWDRGAWHPSPTGWDDLGGVFNPFIGR